MNIKEIISDELIKKYGFTRQGLAMFLAQCHHESGGFKKLEEILYYTNQTRLLQVYHKYFRNMSSSELDKYLKNSEKVANLVYANRMGNGGVSSGDGYKYRGRGYLQLTGKADYLACSLDCDIDCFVNPDILSKKENGLISALWFFKKNKLINKLDINEVTEKINGGFNGLKERKELYEHYLKIV